MTKPQPKAAGGSSLGKGIAGCLGAVMLGSVLFVGACFYFMVSQPSTPPPARRAGSQPAPSVASPVLELESWQWGEEHSYAIVQGRVTNISSENLRNVSAQISFFTKEGDFITSEDALVEFNPLLPGQTSPFKVMARWNPAMNRAQITFKTLFGGTLPWRDKEKPTPRPKPRSGVVNPSVSPSPGGAALKDEPGPSPLPSPTSFWVIVGSFTERGKSDDMAARLKQKGYAASVLDNGAGRFEIRVGPFASLAEAEPVMDRLRVEGLRPFVVGNPESK
jgi:hypothetical protein